MRSDSFSKIGENHFSEAYNQNEENNEIHQQRVGSVLQKPDEHKKRFSLM